MSELQPTPSPEAIQELLLCARYGEPDDLDDIKAFVATYGSRWLADARDDRGNTCLHMSGGNGHQNIVDYLLPLLPPSALVATNDALSTPLHWMALNYHLDVLRSLCPLLPPDAFLMKNSHGKNAVQEAEEACESWIVPDGGEQTERGRERVRREVVVGYLLGCMGLGVRKEGEKDETKDGEEGEVDEVLQAGAVSTAPQGSLPGVEQGVADIKLGA